MSICPILHVQRQVSEEEAYDRQGKLNGNGAQSNFDDKGNGSQKPTPKHFRILGRFPSSVFEITRHSVSFHGPSLSSMDLDFDNIIVRVPKAEQVADLFSCLFAPHPDLASKVIPFAFPDRSRPNLADNPSP